MDTMIAEKVVQGIDLDQIFDLDNFVADLREGVMTNETKGRVCLLSTDLLGGVYNALLAESGPAWGLLMKNCGRVWGQRLARKLLKETELTLGKSYVELPLEEYLLFVTRYFSFHGWGLLELDISQTQSRGIVEAKLRHSIFAEVIKEKKEQEMVNHMISGILASFFSFVSGQDLDCIQTQCSSCQKSESLFLVSSLERVEEVEELVESGADHQEVLEKI